MVETCSEIEPKQANPAFFVLAPVGRKPRSKTVTFNDGCWVFNRRAALRPTSPLPIIITSAPSINEVRSQYEKFFVVTGLKVGILFEINTEDIICIKNEKWSTPMIL